MLLVCAMTASVSARVAADEAKEEPLPQVVLTLPLAVQRGKPVTLTLRGLRLDQASEVRMVGADQPSVSIQSKDKASVPNGSSAARVGDTQVVVEFTIPSESTADRVSLQVVTEAGEAAPIALAVYGEGELVEEVEPNDGFSQAQLIHSGQAIVGTIHEGRNVDVYRFSAAVGQTIVATVTADALNSALDSALTLFTADGQLLVYADDGSETRDARLEATLPKDGDYFLVISDALDTGSAAHVYRLSLSINMDGNPRPK